jgi:hypothetical protein
MYIHNKKRGYVFLLWCRIGVFDTLGTSSSSDTDSETVDEFTDKQQQQDNLGANSHFVIMQSDNGQIGLFRVLSDEQALDVNILPKLIRPVESFESSSEALQWLADYDSRN